MISLADLPDTVPLFPLPGVLLLPRGRLPLHVFEPRYLAMFDDALKSNSRLIGMVQPVSGDAPPLHATGCAGRITAFQETDDGRYMVTLTGVSRFDLGELRQGFAPYLRAEVNWAKWAADLGKPDHDPELHRDAFYALLGRYFDHEGLSADWDSLRDAEDELLINALAMMLPFSTEEKQVLLETPSVVERRRTLETLMEFALHAGTGEEQLQ